MDEVRDKIKKLVHKSEIKEINGIDDTNELTEVFRMMAENGPGREEIDEYKEHYMRTAVSLLKEPLSEIPMGRLIQFVDVFEKELQKFKESYQDFRKQHIDFSVFMDQYDKFSSVLSCLSNSLVENGDQETTYIPGLDEMKPFANNVLVVAGETDVNKYYESLEHAFPCYDCLFSYVKKALNENDKALMNAVSYNIDVEDLYVGNLIACIEKYNKNASDM